MPSMDVGRPHLSSVSNNQVVLVDQTDLEMGVADKVHVHRGKGVLHRAFSLFLFREDGALLLQQRSAHKLLWPKYWSNSCCSHPFPGEGIVSAAERRAAEELGVSITAEFIYKFSYHARYDHNYSEREMCSVLCGIVKEVPRCNREEIASHEFIPWQEITSLLEQNPLKFTPWLKLEWPLLLEKGYPQKILGIRFW